MPKTVRNRRNQPDSDAPEAALEAVATSPAVEEEPRQAAQPNHDDDDEDLGLTLLDEGGDDDDDEDQPAPRARRPVKKRGRRPAAADAPITFADVVNDPALNWQEHRVVVYRKTVTKDMKAVMKANSGRTWIDQIAGPFDEEFGEAYLRKHYGGGVFSVYLQEKVAGSKKWDELMEAEYAIAGAAKYTEEEAAAYNKMNPQQGVAPSGDRSEVGMIVDLLQRQMDKADAPQAAAMQALADSIRTGQQVSTEMLMSTVKQIIELRGSNQGNSDTSQLLQTMLAMVEKMAARKPDGEPQKTGIQQIEEFVRLQRLINEAAPKPAPGPMDKLAEVLMARAVESIVPGADVPTAAVREPWWQSLLKPLASNLPALVTGVGSFLSQQAQVRQQILREELQARRMLLREQMAAQRGEALPPVTDTPPPADDPARRQQEQQVAAQAAVMDTFISALTAEYFAGGEPEDTAVTLGAAFPQVVTGLQQQLGPLGEWWANPQVMGQLGVLYPGMRPLLSHPGFPAWIAQVWEHLKQEEPEQEAEQAADTTQS